MTEEASMTASKEWKKDINDQCQCKQIDGKRLKKKRPLFYSTLQEFVRVNTP